MRRRIFLVIGCTLLAMLAIIWFASRAILLDSYEGLERSYAERDVQRVKSDLETRIESLGATTADYAFWTDMYNFVQHPTKEFSDVNLSDAAAANLGTLEDMVRQNLSVNFNQTLDDSNLNKTQYSQRDC